MIGTAGFFVLLLVTVPLFTLVAWRWYVLGVALYLATAANLGMVSNIVSLQTADGTSLVELRDVLFLLVVVIGVLRRRGRVLREPAAEPVIRPILWLLLLVPLGVAVGLGNHARSIEVARDAVISANWILVPLVFANVERWGQARRLLGAVLGISALVALGHLAEVASRNRLQLVTGTQGDVATKLLRNFPDGWPLVVLGFCLSAALFLAARKSERPWGGGAVLGVAVLTGASIVLMQARGVIAVSGLAVLGLFLLARRVSFGRVGLVAGAAAIVLGSSLFVARSALGPDALRRSLVRVTSLSPSGGGTLEDVDPRRFVEAVATVDVLRAHPLTGVGMGTYYYDPSPYGGGTGAFAHNGYLWYAVKLGLPGLFLVLLALVRIGGITIGSARRLDASPLAVLVLGLGLGMGALALVANLSNVIGTVRGLPFFAVGLGLIVRLHHELESGSGGPGARAAPAGRTVPVADAPAPARPASAGA
ncbi:MAG: O-antigen ligase family protein [Gemmatimonadota bacterium]